MLVSALHVHERRGLEVPGVIIHAIAPARPGESVRTRCGKVACVMAANVGPTRYELLTERGTKLYGSHRSITCKKCIKGMTNDRSSRTAVSSQRTVEARYNIAGQAIRAHSRRA